MGLNLIYYTLEKINKHYKKKESVRDRESKKKVFEIGRVYCTITLGTRSGTLILCGLVIATSTIFGHVWTPFICITTHLSYKDEIKIIVLFWYFFEFK